MKTYIGIDNGVTGSIGIIYTRQGVSVQRHMPVIKCLNYTKSKQFLNRVNGTALTEFLREYHQPCSNTMAAIERPMVNPGRFKATISAVRCLEAVLIVLELLKIPYMYIDSKEWQRELLPSGLQKDELKVASMQVGQRLFPHIDFSSFDDADGILIAEYIKRKSL